MVNRECETQTWVRYLQQFVRRGATVLPMLTIIGPDLDLAPSPHLGTFGNA